MNIYNEVGELILVTLAELLSTGDLVGAELGGANLEGYEFGALILSNVDLSRANLSLSVLYGDSLIDVDLTETNLKALICRAVKF